MRLELVCRFVRYGCNGPPSWSLRADGMRQYDGWVNYQVVDLGNFSGLLLSFWVRPVKP